MTVGNLLTLLAVCLKRGEILRTDLVILATDEEGNSYSELCDRGITVNKGQVIFSPKCFKKGKEGGYTLDFNKIIPQPKNILGFTIVGWWQDECDDQRIDI